MNEPAMLRGELVYLSAENGEVMAAAMSRWARNSSYWRLMAGSLAQLHSAKATQQWYEKMQDDPDGRVFAIRTIDGDRLVGELGLDGIQWQHGESFVGISIGEESDWGKGYGTDAMRVLLRYAFHELNLERVSLNVFDYNPRAIRSYEKVGFVREGLARQFMQREGQRWDVVYMGILKPEWEQRYGYSKL